MAVNICSGGHTKHFTVVDIEMRSMAPADNLAILQMAITDWPPIMCADIVETKELSVHVKENDHPIIARDDEFSGICNLGYAGDGNKISHGRSQDDTESVLRIGVSQLAGLFIRDRVFACRWHCPRHYERS